jgi:hypothetical protein
MNSICIIWGSIADYLTLLITTVGLIFAFIQLISYRKELKNKMFIEYRQRFKSDPINIKVLELMNTNKDDQLTKYEVIHFIGFYEELHKMMEDKLISKCDLIYFFGSHYKEAFQGDYIKNLIDLNDPYWIRASKLLEIITKEEDCELQLMRKKIYCK